MNVNYSAVLEKSIFLNILKQISLILILGVALIVQAAPGDLDTTFAGTGKLRTGFGGGDDRGNAVAVQADGKIIVAGASVNATYNEFSVVRYNTDGSLDTSFDFDGKAFVSFVSFNTHSYATAVKIQPGDGKIVVAGYTGNFSQYDFAVARLNPDGSLDTSFDGDGKVITPVGASEDYAYGLAIQSDGGIIVAGRSANDSNNYDFAVVRYNTNGSPDNSFDGDGKVITAINGMQDDDGRAVTIQSDGKIIVAGYSEAGSSHDFALVRYNTNGSLDNSFGSGGIVTTPIGTNSDRAYAVAIQPGNGVSSPDRIVVAGNSYDGTSYDFAVVRYNLNGSLDTTFDGDGIVTTPTAVYYASGIVIESFGNQASQRRIIVVGTNRSNGGDFTLVRYNNNGSLDTAFGGGDGIVTTPIGAGFDADTAIAIRSGKIIVAGYSNPPGSDDGDFAVVRYNSTDGSLDTTFDGDGKRTDDLGNHSQASARGVAIQSNGRIVVAGSGGGLMRFNSDGTLDTSFGGDGKVSTGVNNAVAIQTDGKIVAATEGSDFGLLRLNADGSPDINVTTPVSTGIDVGNAVAIQADGKIIVAGYANVGAANNPDYDFAIVRYNANGTLDGSFDGDGKLTTPLGTTDDEANAVAIQSDGKIVVAGRAGNTFAAARYNPDGSPDTSFSFDGKVTTPVGTGSSGGGNAMAIQSNGKILIAGYSYNVSSNDSTVIRYNTDGSLDTSFDGDGIATTPVDAITDVGNSIAVQTDGRILVAGSRTNNDFAVFRFNTNGSLDTSYGNSGKVLVDVSGGKDIAYGIALDSSGKAVVVGEADRLFGVARILGDAPLAPAIEADVNPRPAQVGNPNPGQSGDGFVSSGDVTQIRRFVLGLDTPDAPPNTAGEFQKADCAPLSPSFGDGIIASGDVTQARRYALGLDSAQFANGPTAPASPLTEASTEDGSVEENTGSGFDGNSPLSHQRTVRPVAVSRVGNVLTVGIILNTNSGETLANSLSFTLNFTTTDLTNPTNIRLGSGGNSASLGFNDTQAGAGRLGILLDLPPPQTFAGGSQQLVLIDFTVAAGPQTTTVLSFGNTPTPRFIADANGNRLDDATTFMANTVSVTGPTAASVTVSGRVLSPSGRGLARARVTITDQNGETRSALTNSFGYYRFDDVEAGQTYIFEVRSKRYRFAPQVVTVTEELTDLNFTAAPLTRKKE